MRTGIHSAARRPKGSKPMNQLASRRAFLRGKVLRPNRTAIRPPGAVVDGFFDLCRDCDACVQACPQNIIEIDPQGWPAIRFDAGPCTFCGNCVEACPTGALDPEQVRHWPWRAIFGTSCLSMNGVTCRICQDACDEDALRFRPRLGGRFDPVLKVEACTGCGACASACPVKAISFTRHAQSDAEVTP